MESKTFWVSASITISAILLNYTLLQLYLGVEVSELYLTPIKFGILFLAILIIVYCVSLYLKFKKEKGE